MGWPFTKWPCHHYLISPPCPCSSRTCGSLSPPLSIFTCSRRSPFTLAFLLVYQAKEGPAVESTWHVRVLYFPAKHWCSAICCFMQLVPPTGLLAPGKEELHGLRLVFFHRHDENMQKACISAHAYAHAHSLCKEHNSSGLPENFLLLPFARRCNAYLEITFRTRKHSFQLMQYHTHTPGQSQLLFHISWVGIFPPLGTEQQKPAKLQWNCIFWLRWLPSWWRDCSFITKEWLVLPSSSKGDAHNECGIFCLGSQSKLKPFGGCDPRKWIGMICSSSSGNKMPWAISNSPVKCCLNPVIRCSWI